MAVALSTYGSTGVAGRPAEVSACFSLRSIGCPGIRLLGYPSDWVSFSLVIAAWDLSRGILTSCLIVTEQETDSICTLAKDFANDSSISSY